MLRLTIDVASEIMMAHLNNVKKVSRISGLDSVDTMKALFRTFVALNVQRSGQLNSLFGDEFNVANYYVDERFEFLLLPFKLVAYGDYSMPNLLGKDFRNTPIEGEVLNFMEFNALQRSILNALKLEVKMEEVAKSKRFVRELALELLPHKYSYDGMYPIIKGQDYILGFPINVPIFEGQFTPKMDEEFIFRVIVEKNFN